MGGKTLKLSRIVTAMTLEMTWKICGMGLAYI